MNRVVHIFLPPKNKEIITIIVIIIIIANF